MALTKVDIHAGEALVVMMVNMLLNSANEGNYLAIHLAVDYAAKNSAELLSVIRNTSYNTRNALVDSTVLNPGSAANIYGALKDVLIFLGETDHAWPGSVTKNDPEIVRITRQELKRALFNSDGSVNELIAEVLKALEPEDYDSVLDYYRQRLKNPADGVIRLSDAANLKRLTEPGNGGMASLPVEVAVNLDGGARLQTSLSANLLSKLWSPSDSRRKHYQFAQDYQIVKAQEGQLKLVGAPRWTKTRTPLSDVDGNGVDDTLGILDKIKELDALRKKEGEPQRIIRVLDWGAGEGVALIELKRWLDDSGISNVELIGYSDIYYLSWHNVPEGITFIFDVTENLIKHLEGKKIDLIYSRWGIYHYTEEALDREEVVQRFRDLKEILSPAGEIRSDFFYLRDYEITASGFDIMSITGKLGTKMYPIKDNTEDVEFAGDGIRDTSNAPGGIDLNPALLDLQIKRDGNGVPLPLPMQPIEDMHIEGFLPIIINVTPVTNLPLLLGLVDTEQDADEIRPAMKAREPEEVSYLN